MKKIYDTENLYSAFHQFIKVGERIWAVDLILHKFDVLA